MSCIDIDENRARGIVGEISAAGGKAFPVVADMTDRAQVDRALDKTLATLGGLDVCVDIIGKATWNRVEEFSDEDWQWTILNNLTHVFDPFQSAGRRMIEQGTGGSLVALASVDGIAAAGYHAPYGVAKAGVISLVKTFADELGRHGIRANAVAPATWAPATRTSLRVSSRSTASTRWPHLVAVTSPTACSFSRPHSWRESRVKLWWWTAGQLFTRSGA